MTHGGRVRSIDRPRDAHIRIGTPARPSHVRFFADTDRTKHRFLPWFCGCGSSCTGFAAHHGGTVPRFPCAGQRGLPPLPVPGFRENCTPGRTAQQSGDRCAVWPIHTGDQRTGSATGQTPAFHRAALAYALDSTHLLSASGTQAAHIYAMALASNHLPEKKQKRAGDNNLHIADHWLRLSKHWPLEISTFVRHLQRRQ